MTHQLGDAPIEPKLHDMMNELARKLDVFFNLDLKGDQREIGFVLLVFPFEGHEGRANYISNAKREDVVVMLKEQLARFEGQPEQGGRA
jgi:hypothetical protein